uniref:Uncharacterized protein n=1 Tax=Triticum urartu TaxID=4572 RepID=A0A8R7QMB8_TRIUA
MDLKQNMAQLKAEEKRAEVGVGPEKKSPGKEGGSMGPLRRGEKELHFHGGILPHGCVPLLSSSLSAPWRPAEKRRQDEVRRRGWAKKEGRDQPVPDLATSHLVVAGCGGSR